MVNSVLALTPELLIGAWGLDPDLAAKMATLLIQRGQPEALLQSSDQKTVKLSASGLAQMDPDAWVDWDACQLTLGRDSFGRYPLYWLQQGSVIWFASRLDWLQSVVVPQLHKSALYAYSCFSYVPTPLTPLEGIQAIPAGVIQTWEISDQAIRAREPRLNREWREAPPILQDEATSVQSLQDLLQATIIQQIQDVQDEPVGILLSGGLDSSTVAALLVQTGVKVRAYTLDFGSYGQSEHSYAQQVADWLQIPLIPVNASPRQVKKHIIPTIQALDLPFGDSVTVPLYLLCQAAAQEVRILFNGEGGDQLFAGWTNKPLIAASVYEGESPDIFLDQYLRTFHRLWGYEASLFHPAFYALTQAINPQDWIREALDPTYTHSLLGRLRRASLMLKGAQNIQPRATQLALAHGLKLRSPFCDPALADWTFQVPGTLMLKGSCEKYLLKRAVEPWLPPDIVWRSKRGMGVPMTTWCLEAWWGSLGEWLNPGILEAEQCWQPDIALRLANGKLGTFQGRRIGEILWLLISWQLWRSLHLGEAPGIRSWYHPFWLPRYVWRMKEKWI